LFSWRQQEMPVIVGQALASARPSVAMQRDAPGRRALRWPSSAGSCAQHTRTPCTCTQQQQWPAAFTDPMAAVHHGTEYRAQPCQCPQPSTENGRSTAAYLLRVDSPTCAYAELRRNQCAISEWPLCGAPVRAGARQPSSAPAPPNQHHASPAPVGPPGCLRC
jgi:hypothetical protein